MNTINVENLNFLEGSTNLQDAYLEGLNQATVFALIKTLSGQMRDIQGLSKRLFLSQDIIEELQSEAILRAINSLEEKGTSKDIDYSGRNKKIVKDGKYVLVGDLFAFYSTTLLNLCKDRKKADSAQRRGGGKITFFNIDSSYMGSRDSSSFDMAISESVVPDEGKYFQNEAAIDNSDLYKNFFKELSDREVDLELAQFTDLLLREEASKKEIIDEMGITYHTFNKLKAQLENIGSEILKEMNIA